MKNSSLIGTWLWPWPMRRCAPRWHASDTEPAAGGLAAELRLSAGFVAVCATMYASFGEGIVLADAGAGRDRRRPHGAPLHHPA